MMFSVNPGGIVNRQKLARIAKGYVNGNEIFSHKPEYIRNMIESWSDNEQTIVWCKYNNEQDAIAKIIPNSASVSGATNQGEREDIIRDFKAGKIRTLITKPKILGFGLNLHMVTRQVFSTLQDSYEEYYQAVKRSNRYGASSPLHVHIPVTEVEMPMVENVLRKSRMVVSDTKTQESIFASGLKRS